MFITKSFPKIKFSEMRVCINFSNNLSRLNLLGRINNQGKLLILKNTEVRCFSETPPPPQKKKIDLSKISVYKRIPNNLGISFQTNKSQIMLKESIEEGNCVAFFDIIDQFQTQADPTFCGPTTLIVILNSLGIDPNKKWKGIWRWYFEEVLKCCDLERIKKYGITLEEFSIIAKCNGIFTECFRPDENEQETEKKILAEIRNLPEKQNKIKGEFNSNLLDEANNNSLYSDNNNILVHNPDTNQDCKYKNKVIVKRANLDLFRTALYASVRRHKFLLVTNTSRKALRQTGEGHFSCIASYHEKSDNLLMLDTARFKYNSMWFSLKNVFDSFLPLDSTTKNFRGFMLCSKYYYRCPKLCKTSFDSESAKFSKNIVEGLRNIYIDNKIQDFEIFITKIIDNLSLYLNSNQLKSIILYYVHDLENRTSFYFKEKECSLFINYENVNKNFEKKQFYKMLGIIVNYQKISDVLLEKYKSNKEFREFLKFLNYITDNNFTEIFIFLILSTLKLEILADNKFKFEIFDKIDSSKNINLLKNQKNEENFFSNNQGSDVNENKKIDDDSAKDTKQKISKKIIFLEMDNFRSHLGLY